MKAETLRQIIDVTGLKNLKGFTFTEYIHEPECGVILYRNGAIHEVPVANDGRSLYDYLKGFVRRWSR